MKFFNIILILLAIAFGFWGLRTWQRYNQPSALDAPKNSEVVALSEEEKSEGVMLTDKGIKYLVDPDKILSGGPPKDGIPSIDNPRFVSTVEADEWIEDNELVLAIIYKGVKRVYPLQIMTWHEIVNDSIAGDPILISCCPLCGSGIAYERKIDGQEVEFGTSGNYIIPIW